MPHSSGGGSHSGGSHGGSSHHSSGGGSHSYSSGSSEPNPLLDSKFSRRPYSGARKYVKYNRSGKMRYIYHAGHTSDPDWALTIIAVIAFSCILLPMIWLAGKFAYHQPKPVDLGSYESVIVVDDHIDLVDDAEVEESLKPFREATGVTPSVEIVYDSEWIDDFVSLQSFAYSEYMRWFDDEKHWLIVISYPDEYRTQSFVDWKWEGMIGDDVYMAISSKKEAIFTDIFQKHMIRSTPDELEPHIKAAFDEFSPRAMEPEKSKFAFVLMLIFGGIYLAFMRFFIKNHIDHMVMREAYVVEKGAVQLECEYCGCMYISGTISVCPHCGGAIPAYNPGEAHRH